MRTRGRAPPACDAAPNRHSIVECKRPGLYQSAGLCSSGPAWAFRRFCRYFIVHTCLTCSCCVDGTLSFITGMWPKFSFSDKRQCNHHLAMNILAFFWERCNRDGSQESILFSSASHGFQDQSPELPAPSLHNSKFLYLTYSTLYRSLSSTDTFIVDTVFFSSPFLAVKAMQTIFSRIHFLLLVLKLQSASCSPCTPTFDLLSQKLSNSAENFLLGIMYSTSLRSNHH